MSIYGPQTGLSEPSETPDKDETFKYIDRVARGIAKELESKAFLLDGTSKPINDITLSDNKILDLADPSKATDAANKSYVDRRFRSMRKFVTVWAATKGPLTDGKFEWGFGAGVKYNRMSGYVMLGPGAIHKIGLSGGALSSDSVVKISVNSAPQDDFFVTKPRGQRSVVKLFTEPLYLNQGDVINLVSVVPDGVVSDAQATVVSMLIELNV